MPAVTNLDGSATAYDLAVSPFTGWQHGRIDASAIAHVASFARRSCHLVGWVDVSPFRDPTRTTFAVAHEVRVNPRYESRFIQVLDKCYAVTTVAHVGNSSCAFLTKVFLQPKASMLNYSTTTPATPVTPNNTQGYLKAASILLGPDGEHPSEAQLKAKDYHEWMVANGEHKYKAYRMAWEAEVGADASSPPPLTAEDFIPVELGMTTLTIVYISTITRKSLPFKAELKELLLTGAKNTAMFAEWKLRGNNDRLKINFNLMRRAGDQLFSTLENEALTFSASAAVGLVPITTTAASSPSPASPNPCTAASPLGVGGGEKEARKTAEAAGTLSCLPEATTDNAFAAVAAAAAVSPASSVAATTASSTRGLREGETPFSPPFIAIPITSGTTSSSNHGNLAEMLARMATHQNHNPHGGGGGEKSEDGAVVVAAAGEGVVGSGGGGQLSIEDMLRAEIEHLMRLRNGVIHSLKSPPPASSSAATTTAASPSPANMSAVGSPPLHPLTDQRFLTSSPHQHESNASPLPPPAAAAAMMTITNRHMAIFTNRRALRPADFDFNLHMNMNMYVNAVLDTLKHAMRDFLDLQRKQTAVAKAREKYVLSQQHGGGGAESPTQQHTEQQQQERGTPIVPLDYQFPVVIVDEHDDGVDSTTQQQQRPPRQVVSVHHLGEVLGRLGYQSVVSKFTNKSHSNKKRATTTTAAANKTSTPSSPHHGHSASPTHHHDDDDHPSSPAPPFEDYMSRQTSVHPAAATVAAPPESTTKTAAPSSSVSITAVKRDAYDMTRFVSVEECVLTSRIDYLREVTELTSELEVTVMIPPPPPPPLPSGDEEGDAANDSYFAVHPETLRVSAKKQAKEAKKVGGYDANTIPIHYAVRCVPPAWVEDPTPYLASSGELVLRPVEDLAVYMPSFGGATLEKEEESEKGATAAGDKAPSASLPTPLAVFNNVSASPSSAMGGN